MLTFAILLTSVMLLFKGLLYSKLDIPTFIDTALDYKYIIIFGVILFSLSYKYENRIRNRYLKMLIDTICISMMMAIYLTCSYFSYNGCIASLKKLIHKNPTIFLLPLKGILSNLEFKRLKKITDNNIFKYVVFMTTTLYLIGNMKTFSMWKSGNNSFNGVFNFTDKFKWNLDDSKKFNILVRDISDRGKINVPYKRTNLNNYTLVRLSSSIGSEKKEDIKKYIVDIVMNGNADENILKLCKNIRVYTVIAMLSILLWGVKNKSITKLVLISIFTVFMVNLLTIHQLSMMVNPVYRLYFLNDMGLLEYVKRLFTTSQQVTE